MSLYDVDYFIKKFRAIPHNKWLVGRLEDSEGRRCAAGHCRDYKLGWNAESTALADLIRSNYFINPAWINDGYHASFQQKTPKNRILKALICIKRRENATT